MVHACNSSPLEEEIRNLRSSLATSWDQPGLYENLGERKEEQPYNIQVKILA